LHLVGDLFELNIKNFLPMEHSIYIYIYIYIYIQEEYTMYMYIHRCVCVCVCVCAHAYVYGTTFSCICHSVAYISPFVH